jgi:hypothetical protein
MHALASLRAASLRALTEITPVKIALAVRLGRKRNSSVRNIV